MPETSLFIWLRALEIHETSLFDGFGPWKCPKPRYLHGFPGLREICRASEGLGSSGGADVWRAPTGLALAFEVQLQSGAGVVLKKARGSKSSKSSELPPKPQKPGSGAAQIYV